MSDSDWRLSGGIGGIDPVDGRKPQVLLQGIGYPLRPVSAVPPDGTEESLNEESVAAGEFMTFIGDWQAGKYHLSGAVCSNGEWTMIANKATLENPFPVPAGNAELGTEPWTPATQSNESVVYAGHLYTFNESCLIKQLNVYVTQLTPDTNYRIISVTTYPDKDPVTTVIEEPILQENAWVGVTYANQIVPAGTTILIFIDGLNSGSDNEVSGGWNFTGQDNVNGPVAQAWNHDNANSIVRISKTDLDGTDRSSELAGITVNSTMLFADTNNPSAFNQYRVTAQPPVDQGTYLEYQVVLQEQGEGGVPLGTTSMTATIPIPQPTEYAEQVGVVPVYTGPNVTAQGFLEFSGVDQGGAANKYGIDLLVESVEGSEDWDVLSYNQP